MSLLLTRDQFRTAVFERDGHRCVICGAREGDRLHDSGHPARLDAHHIIERRLWSDGGYYLDNGATLCDYSMHGCHMDAETTSLSVERIREAAGITKIILPEDMYPDHVYDKWGNTILADGRRTKGPLFNDASVQKVLGMVCTDENFGSYIPLDLFTDYVKYPRTYHLPWSPGITDDDRVISDLSIWEGRNIVVTEKMDGENFSGYRDYCHARSVDGRHHYTRDWAKSYWMQRSYELPDGWRVCAENISAKHSIGYGSLPTYLMAFSIWDEHNVCLDWASTKEWFALLDLVSVPVIYEGPWNEKLLRNLAYGQLGGADTHEGYVVRDAGAFTYGNFRNHVAKFVRANHVQTQVHWFYGQTNHEINHLGY